MTDFEYDFDEQPSLLKVILEQNAEEAIRLIDKGYDVNETEEESGNTPLILAAQLGLHIVCKHLIKKGAVVSTKNKKGESAYEILFTHKRYGA